MSTQPELLAERAELIAKNEAATSWGAAVGARSERIKAIDSELRRMESAVPEPVRDAQQTQGCGCGPMCESKGLGNCRLHDVSPTRKALRSLVDAVWQHATESTAVPSTTVADKLITKMIIPSAAQCAPQPSGEQIALLQSGNEYMCDEIEALRQRLADTEQALQPFKRAADAFDDLNPRDHMKLDAGGLTVGDLRQARAALSSDAVTPPAVSSAAREALEKIAQRANESGTGEMGLLDTIHAIHRIATTALPAAGGEASKREAVLRDVLQQALDCIQEVTPEDMTPEDARSDTIERIRVTLRKDG